MFRRLKTTKITPEQEQVLEEARKQQEQTKEILQEVRIQSKWFKVRADKNHFAEGWRQVLWGHNGN